MAERSLVEILLRAKGAREVYDSGKLASRGITDIGRAAVRTNERTRLLRHGLYGIGAAGATMGVLVYEGAKKSIEAYAEFQGAAAQVDRQIKLTGGSANVTAAHVEGLANKLSMTAGIADKFSILGGESLLLTFKNIRNEGGKTSQLFDRTSTAAIDMTAALRAAGKNTTPQQAFMALGRAVSDPAKASQYLRRALVTLSPAEDAHIKRLVILNKTTQAQEAVLSAVEEKYKGAAKTAGKTLPGALGRLHVASMNIKEDIGKGLSPVVGGLADELGNVATSADPAFSKLGDDLHRTLSRKDLSLSEKLKLSEADVKKDLGPLWSGFTKELHDAHLGQKFEHELEVLAPKAAMWAGHAGLSAAKAFAHAWWDSDIWGKTFTTAFLLHKFGAFGKLASLLLGRGKGGVGGALGKLAPTPVFVTNWEKFPGVGSTPIRTAERDAEKVAAGAGARGVVAKAFGFGEDASKLGGAEFVAPFLLLAGAGKALGKHRPGIGAWVNPRLDTGGPGVGGMSYAQRQAHNQWLQARPDTRLAGYPDMPPRTRVAFPTLHATATVHTTVMLPNGLHLTDAVKQVELQYKPGGRG